MHIALVAGLHMWLRWEVESATMKDERWRGVTEKRGKRFSLLPLLNRRELTPRSAGHPKDSIQHLSIVFPRPAVLM